MTVVVAVVGINILIVVEAAEAVRAFVTVVVVEVVACAD